jgi:transposase
MKSIIPADLTFCEVGHMPIIKAFAQKIELVETLDTMVGSQMELSPGICILAMVLDTLSGRTPLYRLERFFQEKDTELLLGQKIEPGAFADHNVARVMDKIFETGTQKIFSNIANNAINVFDINAQRVHFDTTSVTVFGDYEDYEEPFKIDYGYSKDKRPDLKQFLIAMLCVDRNIPIIGACKDGNASDKTLNNELLGGISKHMAKHGLAPGAFVYVADAAFVTPDNLMKSAVNKIKFLSRLPATYKECARATEQAVCADQWIEIGTLNTTDATAKRPAAVYRGYETLVNLHGDNYRAVVVHSSNNDKRRHKRIDRMLAQKRKELESTCKQINAQAFYCHADAEKAADQLCKAAVGSYHRLQWHIKEVDKYPRGRPATGKQRIPIGHEYALEISIEEDQSVLSRLRLEAGCFVLLTNLTDPQDYKQWSAKELLTLYKDQGGIEQNFSFLKDPVIVNSIFLKKPQRIEVLGLVLLIALLIWRLMEKCMRKNIETTGNQVTGWKKKTTNRPTSFMMTTKFLSILVARSGEVRQLARPLRMEQKEFLQALGVSPDAFVTP